MEWRGQNKQLVEREGSMVVEWVVEEPGIAVVRSHPLCVSACAALANLGSMPPAWQALLITPACGN